MGWGRMGLYKVIFMNTHMSFIKWPSPNIHGNGHFVKALFG